MSDAVIVAAVRSAIGKKKGALASTRADDLLAHVLKALVARAKVDPREVEDVITGCVTQIGEQGFNVVAHRRADGRLPDRDHRHDGRTGSAARRSRRSTSPRRR